MLEANEMKVLRKIIYKTKIDGIRSQQIRISCSIQPINEWMVRRRRRIIEWDEYVSRICAERLVKISRENIPPGRSPVRPKRKWSDLIPDQTGGFPYKEEGNGGEEE